jgi:hypothetical protein
MNIEHWVVAHKAVAIAVAVAVLLLLVVLLSWLCWCICRRRKERSVRQYLMFDDTESKAPRATVDGIVQGETPPPYTAPFPLQDIKVFDMADTTDQLKSPPLASVPASERNDLKIYRERYLV